MDCAFCEEPMARQDDYLTDGAGTICNKGAIYACLCCGREWRWELGVPGLHPLFDAEDFAPPEPPWTEEDAQWSTLRRN